MGISSQISVMSQALARYPTACAACWPDAQGVMLTAPFTLAVYMVGWFGWLAALLSVRSLMLLTCMHVAGVQAS